MELREPIEDINKKLVEKYGKFEDGRPNFRVVFSNDQFEKRWTDRTDEGFELIHPEVRLLPKYKWCSNRYVLERLIPIIGETDLTKKTNYEPAWVFQDRYQNYLPPFFEGCVHVIESILSAIDKANTHVKYKDTNTSPEERAAALQKVQDELFGNETEVGDHLAYGTGIVSAGDGNQKTVIH